MNLETLELTINGTAEGATGGIDTLSTHIAALGTILSNTLNSLKEFNGQLSQMKTISASIRMPNIGKMTGASGASSSAKKNGIALTQEQAMTMLNMSKTQLAYREAQEKAASFANNAQSGKYTAKQLIEQAKSTQSATGRYEKLADAERKAAEEETRLAEETAKANTPLAKFKQGFAGIKEGFGNLTKGFTGFFSKVKRIATSMLIRSAIRGLIKSLKEGVNNLYEWSKLNNGEFAASMDKLKAKSLQLKNSIGASIAPVIQAAIPVINSLMNAAINAFNWVNQLISLLTGKSTWTKATENADAYADAAKGAGGAAKEWLAAFDELNVMNNSGGGGGGGGSSADYSNMFEEIGVFDQQIRDIVKFLQDNFESIKGIAAAIGVAILAWKISDAFATVLPALSKIAGLIGIGAVIAITLQATWMFSQQFMNTGDDGWLWADLLTTAVGSVAAWSMAKKLFGGNAGYYAAGITIALSAVTGIIANVQDVDCDALSATSIKKNIIDSLKMGAAAGIMLVPAVGGGYALAIGAGVAVITFLATIGLKLQVGTRNIKWGDIDLTTEEIQTFVDTKMFDTSANLKITKLQATMDETIDLEKTVREAIPELNSSIAVLKLGLDKENTLAELEKQVNGENGQGGLVSQIGELCNFNIAEAKLLFTSVNIYDGEGNLMDSEQLLSASMGGWNAVSQQAEEKGKELTKLLVKGAKEQLTPEEESYAQELLEWLSDVSEKVSRAKEFGDARAKFATQLSDLTKGSFDDAVKLFEEQSDANKKTLQESLRRQIQGWYVLADLTDDPILKAQYIKIAEDMAAGFNQTVDEELAKENEPAKKMMSEWIGKQFNVDEDELRLDLQSGDTNAGDVIVGELYRQLYKALEENKLDNEWVEKFDLTGWDLLTEKAKTSLLESVKLIDLSDVKKVAPVIPATDLIKFSNWDRLTKEEQDEFKKSIVNAYGASGISALKSQFPEISALDIVKMVDWQQFTIKEKFEFLNAIKSAFGSDQAIAAAKNAGVNIGDLVKEGMKSKDKAVQDQAKEWSKLIKGGVESETPVVSPELSETAANNVANSLKSIIEAKPATMSKISAVFMPGYPQNLSDQINKLSATINTTAGLEGNAQTKIQNALNALGVFKITVQASVEGLGNSLREKFKAALSGIEINLGGNLIGKITAKAMGGLVTSGDLFIANENGVPEMVGRFGNQTAVANTDQIVNGISQGVAAANSQQNILLAEQNNLLRAILQKDGSVRLEASAALGRVARQSLNMYGAMTGV